MGGALQLQVREVQLWQWMDAVDRVVRCGIDWRLAAFGAAAALGVVWCSAAVDGGQPVREQWCCCWQVVLRLVAQVLTWVIQVSEDLPWSLAMYS